MPPLFPPEDPCQAHERYVSAAGSPDHTEYLRPTLPGSSIVISRNFGSTNADHQTYIPNRLLKGLLPEALVDDYVFWQNADETLIGYQKKEVLEKTQTVFVSNNFTITTVSSLYDCHYILTVHFHTNDHDKDQHASQLVTTLSCLVSYCTMTVTIYCVFTSSKTPQ